MICDVCKKELSGEEVVECKFVCSKCLENISKQDWWNQEGRRKLISTTSELMNWKRKAEERGEFGDKALIFIKNKGLFDEFINFLKENSIKVLGNG